MICIDLSRINRDSKNLEMLFWPIMYIVFKLLNYIMRLKIVTLSIIFYELSTILL